MEHRTLYRTVIEHFEHPEIIDNYWIYSLKLCDTLCIQKREIMSKMMIFGAYYGNIRTIIDTKKSQLFDNILVSFLKCTQGGNRTHTSEETGF